MSKNTYLYMGPAFRQDKDGRLYYLATDDNGEPVKYKMFCEAKSAEQAANFFKFRLRNMYVKRVDPIKLLKKYMFVKKGSDKHFKPQNNAVSPINIYKKW